MGKAAKTANGMISSLKLKLAWLLKRHSPFRTLGTIAVAVFIGEVLVMFTLALLPPMPMITEAILDSTLLIVVISPALYFFLFRPILRHIEGREAAERNLRKNRDLLQTVFNGISDPLILLDGNMNVRMINTAAGRYYRTGGSITVDQPCRIALMKGARVCEECEIPSRLAENSDLVLERKGLFDDSRIEQVAIYRPKGLSDLDDAIIVKVTDVTEARALERQLRQRERLVSLGLLISGVAHEINNPNSFISFNLPILREYLQELIPIADDHASGRRDFEIANMAYADFRRDLFKLIDNMAHGSARIDSIISQLKDFSRIKDTNNFRRVDIKALLEKVVELASSTINRMVKRLEIEVPDNLPMLNSDGEAIEHIVMNLLINACQACDKDDSWVSVKARTMTDEAYPMAVEIADNGCGMDEGTLQHIFEPLYTTKGPDSGTGLGLYVSHNLIESLGGRIDVKSVRGEGSTFTVFLPDSGHP